MPSASTFEALHPPHSFRGSAGDSLTLELRDLLVFNRALRSPLDGSEIAALVNFALPMLQFRCHPSPYHLALTTPADAREMSA